MRRYLTPRCLGLHATILALLPAFAALTWWQASRAMAGNSLSWAYTFEWPLFAGYAIYVWWQLIHDEPDEPRVAAPPSEAGFTAPEAGTEEPGWALGETRSRRKARAGVRGVDEGDPAREPGTGEGRPEEDEALAAYNRYLAELDATAAPKTW